MEKIKPTISYLALGDSYTCGEAVEQAQSFPYLLAKVFKQENVALVPTIVAQTGWTTNELEQALDAANLPATFGLVSLLVGVNNQYRGLDIEVFKTEFTRLLGMAIHLAKGNAHKVFVLSIPDYGYTPFGQAQQLKISEEINLYNAICKETAQIYGVKFFNITDISRQGLGFPNLLASDGLHPSGEMYQLWVDSFKSDVMEMMV
jgi:lysophospholipase L1-like esterase